MQVFVSLSTSIYFVILGVFLILHVRIYAPVIKKTENININIFPILGIFIPINRRIFNNNNAKIHNICDNKNIHRTNHKKKHKDNLKPKALKKNHIIATNIKILNKITNNPHTYKSKLIPITYHHS